MTASAGDRTKRVLIIVENLPVPLDRRVWMEATALNNAGYDVTVLCPRTRRFPLAEEYLEDIRILRYNLPAEVSSVVGYFREYLVALWGQIRLAIRVNRERGFDIIHACNPPDTVFLVALPFKILKGIRFLFDHHDLSPEMYEAKFGHRGVLHYLLLLLERITYRLADVVIVTNESFREIARERGKVRDDRIHVVRSGPDLARFQPVPKNDRYRNGRRFLVGYLGVMGEFDGVDHLLQAAHRIVRAEGRTDIQFMLIGTGPMWQELVEEAQNLGIAEYVEFAGRVGDRELIERISSCDVCVDPDPWNEMNDKSTMNKIMEYMALGRPIVQYDLTEGRNSAAGASLYAIPNDTDDLARKILRTVDDEQLRERLGETGRRRMENELGWRHQVPKLLAAYRQLENGTS